MNIPFSLLAHSFAWFWLPACSRSPRFSVIMTSLIEGISMSSARLEWTEHAGMCNVRGVGLRKQLSKMIRYAVCQRSITNSRAEVQHRFHHATWYLSNANRRNASFELRTSFWPSPTAVFSSCSRSKYSMHGPYRFDRILAACMRDATDHVVVVALVLLDDGIGHAVEMGLDVGAFDQFFDVWEWGNG